MSDDYGYAIRIWNDAIQNQLYDTGRYYSRIDRLWVRGTKILFVKRIWMFGECIIGYGIVDKVIENWLIDDKREELYLKRNRYIVCLVLRPLIRFPRPFPIKGTVLEDEPRKHAVRLNGCEVDKILEEAEEYQETQVGLESVVIS